MIVNGFFSCLFGMMKNLLNTHSKPERRKCRWCWNLHSMYLFQRNLIVSSAKMEKSCVNIICISRNYFFTHMKYYSHSKNASTTLNQEIQFEIVRPNINLNIFEYCCNRNCNNIHISVREIRFFSFFSRSNYRCWFHM